MFIKNTVVISLLLSFCMASKATTYYVDAENGDDSWSGQSMIATGSEGPWRSLSKVAKTILVPGDVVLLSCNQAWNETLKISQSGTPDAPIKVGAYGSSCTKPPLISSLYNIPDYAWEPSSNGVWKVQFPLTLISNGNLSSGNSNWRITSPAGDAIINSGVDTCLSGRTPPCLSANGGKSNSVLSSANFALEKGISYQVNFSSFLSPKQIIPNGSLESGTSKWSVWSPSNALKLQSGTSSCLDSQAAPCLTIINSDGSGLLSTGSFSLIKGEAYTLAFSAYIPSNKTIKAIVRQSTGSYTTLGLVSSSVGSGSWKDYRFTFTATATENAARLDFEIPSASMIQFREVNLKLFGKSIKTIVRQDSGDKQSLGLVEIANSLDSQWKDSTFTFTAANSAKDARLDFEIPPNSTVQLQNIVLTKVESAVSVSQLLDSDIPQAIAHHPNRGYDSAAPGSMYFKTDTSSQVVSANGRAGSNYFTTGSDFFLPEAGSIVPGTRVTIRDHGWHLSDVAVSAVTGNKIEVAPNTTYPLYWKGLGYFFTGELWMLDSVGEWYFDSTKQVLYYSSDTVPNSNVSIASSLIGSDLIRKSNIQVDGINFDGMDTGLDVSFSTNIVLSNLDIRNVKSTGVLGTSSSSLSLQNSKLIRIGQDGVMARNSNNVNVTSSVFDQIGLAMDSASKIISIPNSSTAAILTGDNSRVSQNMIGNYAYFGVNSHKNSTVDHNSLTNGCVVLNDCGAVYLDSASKGTKVVGNIVDGLVGNMEGLSSPFSSDGVGIYSDNGAVDNIIEGNTVSNVDYGVVLHDAYNQQYLNNLLFGARRSIIWIQETSKSNSANGDVHDLVFSGNKIFPIIPNGQLKLTSSVTGINDFGSFDGDIFSNYFAPNVASETFGGITKNYTLKQWQAANFNGIPRNIEKNGVINAPLSDYALGFLQSNIIPNANFKNGFNGWSKYGSGGAGPVWALTSCTSEGTQVACLKVDAGAVAGNFSTPSFDIKKGYNYLLSFDILASVDTQVITALVRQAGPTYYNSVMSNALTGQQGTNSWKRYSVIFKATGDARTDGSITGVSGARIDFTGINVGQSLSIANLELVPIGQTPITKSAKIITNPSFSPQSFNCPSSDQLLCDNYISFTEGTKVTWPITLPALGSNIVYSQSLDYPDVDQDGVPDSQDSCLNTVLGAAINSKGCSLQ